MLWNVPARIDSEMFGEVEDLPLLRDHADLGLFVAGRDHGKDEG
jgi:hypothetical protein